MGSCKGDICEEIHTDTLIPELNQSNSFPGNTYCINSCSFWWCKCALPTSACIFYRHYAFPLSETVYEVISCPSWEFRINLHVSIFLTNGPNSEETDNLTPVLTSKWKYLSFTPLTVSQAPTPVNATYFLTNGEKVALFKSNKIPDLHYTDENSAALLNCSLSPSCCTDCRPNQDTLVSCKCRNFVFENLLENPRQLLPLTYGKISLRNIKKDIFSEYNYAPIQLLVTIENFHFISEVDQTSCNILQNKLVGSHATSYKRNSLVVTNVTLVENFPTNAILTLVQPLIKLNVRTELLFCLIAILPSKTMKGFYHWTTPLSTPTVLSTALVAQRLSQFKVTLNTFQPNNNLFTKISVLILLLRSLNQFPFLN